MNATAYDVLVPDFDLIDGLYIILGPSGRGKTLGAMSLASSIRQDVDVHVVNESHAPFLSFDWLLTEFLKPKIGLFGEYAKLLSKKTPLLGGAENERFSTDRGRIDIDADVILFDSATHWMWQSERVKYDMDIDHAKVSFGQTTAKTGGLTGEMEEFLMIADAAAVEMKKTVIWTINIAQYPVGLKDVNNYKEVFNLFKGIVSGVMVPNMVKGGDSTLRISDRMNRDGRLVTLDSKVVNKTAELLRLDKAADDRNLNSASSFETFPSTLPGRG
jgi:hypothetical protein